MNNWTREEKIVTLDLYCRIPFQRSSKTHPEVVRIANILGRSPGAVNMKIGNFGSFDEALKKKGIVGLANSGRLDKEIWDEFNGHWDKLSILSDQIIRLRIADKSDVQATRPSNDSNGRPLGKDEERIVTQRVNQTFFRNAVLASYDSTCCITGISTPSLLVASHIKPWHDSTASERTDPRNGLCLNALHDKAFDKGYMTVTPNGKIHISKAIKTVLEETLYRYFLCYDNKAIVLPEKFLPNKTFLEYHNDVIYQNWECHENE